jgi:hypothetical protein
VLNEPFSLRSLFDLSEDEEDEDEDEGEGKSDSKRLNIDRSFAFLLCLSALSFISSLFFRL